MCLVVSYVALVWLLCGLGSGGGNVVMAASAAASILSGVKSQTWLAKHRPVYGGNVSVA